MKKFIIHIVLFSTILLVINAGLFHLSKKIYYGEYEEHSLSYNSYLLSDSHGLPLKNFAEKEGVYNFSAGSDSYFDMHRKLLYLINYTSVDTIYLTVDDHTLSPYRERTNNADRSIAYALPEEFGSYYKYLVQKYLNRYAIVFQPKTRTVIKKYLIAQIRSFPKFDLDAHTEGTWADINEPDRIKSAVKRAQLQFSYEKSSLKLEDTLKEIILLCKNKNIELIGLKFPLATEYVEVIGEKNYGSDAVFRLNGLVVINLSNAFIDNDELFANQDHLNEAGGLRFVELLFQIGENKN